MKDVLGFTSSIGGKTSKTYVVIPCLVDKKIKAKGIPYATEQIAWCVAHDFSQRPYVEYVDVVDGNTGEVLYTV